MKLSIDRQLDGDRGLQRFGKILLDRLQSEYDVRIVKQGQKSDIHLLIIHGGMKPKAKNVVRLDGVYYDVKRLRMNDPIKSTMKRVDGVVYQSEWCKVFVEGMLKVKPRRSAVIWNGTEQDKFEQARIDKLGFDELFLACSHWRVNKRLKAIVESFIAFRDDEKTGLIIVGDPDFRVKHEAVVYMGQLPGDQLYSLYKSADYFCHICHLDACPNVVVEALSAKTPVLCNNIGGTPELVGNDGIILDLDQPFDFQAIKSMNAVGPKIVDNSLLIDGMKSMASTDWDVDRPDLDVAESARKYYEFFVSLLS